jgi:hypothetical protein
MPNGISGNVERLLGRIIEENHEAVHGSAYAQCSSLRAGQLPPSLAAPSTVVTTICGCQYFSTTMVQVVRALVAA